VPSLAQPAATDPPPSSEGAPIRQIQIVGNQLVSQSYIFSVLSIEPGQIYKETTVQSDIRRLLRTGKFMAAVASTRIEENEVVLTIEVKEKPEVADVAFEGNERFKDKDLLKELDFATGDPLDMFSVNQGRDNLQRLYREKGFGDVEIEVDEQLLREQRVVLYHIVEGSRIRVRKILYEGNESFSPGELTSKISTKTYIWVFRTGAYDPDQLEQDRAELERYYRDQGFLDVRVSHQLSFSPDRQDLAITFVVAEGTRYRINAINLRGNVVYQTAEIMTVMKLLPDDFWQQDVLDLDIKTIQSLYGDAGYVYLQIAPERVFLSDKPGYVDLNINLVENEQITIGRIVIRGNRRTKDKVARRELLFFPEETYSTTKAKTSESRIRESQAFSEAAISPVGEEPGVRDVLVDLVENEQANRILFGAGIGSNNGLVGQFVIENQNFDLFDWPRSLGELFRGQAFRGAGQSLRLQAEPGTEFTRFTLDFNEPYLMDKQLSFGSRLYYFQRGRDAYDEQRVGTNVSFGKRFREGFLKGWASELAFRIEGVDIDDVDFYDAEDIRDVEGSNFLTSVKGSLVLNRTDSRFLPSKGDKFAISYEQYGILGGDDFFGKLTSSYDWYKTLATDVFERKSILGLHARMGYILGDAPVFERFYAGGIGSVRGFEFRGISPRDGINDDSIGGEFMFLTSAEYSFPLYGDNLRGVFFTDMGTVEEDVGLTTWRASVGFGIRLSIDFFGPVPLEFDFAFPIAKDSDDDTQVFSFFFGAIF
jgi:outer membrane protein assembly complex protein YaeT